MLRGAARPAPAYATHGGYRRDRARRRGHGAILEDHRGRRRVSVSCFSLMTGTAIDRMIEKKPERFDTVRVLARNDEQAVVAAPARAGPRFRRELRRVLGVVHQINRRRCDHARVLRRM